MPRSTLKRRSLNYPRQVHVLFAKLTIKHFGRIVCFCLILLAHIAFARIAQTNLTAPSR